MPPAVLGAPAGSVRSKYSIPLGTTPFTRLPQFPTDHVAKPEIQLFQCKYWIRRGQGVPGFMPSGHLDCNTEADRSARFIFLNTFWWTTMIVSLSWSGHYFIFLISGGSHFGRDIPQRKALPIRIDPLFFLKPFLKDVARWKWKLNIRLTDKGIKPKWQIELWGQAGVHELSTRETPLVVLFGKGAVSGNTMNYWLHWGLMGGRHVQ